MSLLELATELQPHEGVGGVPGHTTFEVVPLLDVANCVGILINGCLIELESVIVDDRVDPPPQRRQQSVHDLHDAVYILRCPHMHPRVVHEDGVGVLVVTESILDAQFEHLTSQAHHAGKEQCAVHWTWTIDPRLEGEKTEDLALQIDSRGDLGQDETGWAKSKDAAFGDEGDVLPALVGDFGAERDLPDLIDELAETALLVDGEMAVFDAGLQTATGKRRQEHNVSRSLSEVDRPTTPRDPFSEPAHVHIADAIALGHSEDHRVEASAVDEVEGRGVIDHGFSIHRPAKSEAAQRDAADDARVDRERDEVLDALVTCHASDELGEAHSYVDDCVGFEFYRGSSGNHCSSIDGKWLQRLDRYSDLPGHGGVVAGIPGLLVAVRPGNHDRIDKDARDLNVT